MPVSSAAHLAVVGAPPAATFLSYLTCATLGEGTPQPLHTRFLDCVETDPKLKKKVRLSRLLPDPTFAESLPRNVPAAPKAEQNISSSFLCKNTIAIGG